MNTVGLEKILEQLSRKRESNAGDMGMMGTAGGEGGVDGIIMDNSGKSAAATDGGTKMMRMATNNNKKNKMARRNASAFRLDQMLQLHCAESNNNNRNISKSNLANELSVEGGEFPVGIQHNLLKGNNNGIEAAKVKADQKPQQQGQQLNILTTFLNANPLISFSSSMRDINNVNAQMASSIHSTMPSLPLPAMPMPKTIFSSSWPANNTLPVPQNNNGSTSPSMVVSFSPDVASQGLLAVGGCRQCAKTFTDRLSLIHHFVDHFPTIFYSFEERQQQQQNIEQQQPASSNVQENGIGSRVLNNAQQPTTTTTVDLLGQLTSLFALANGTPTTTTNHPLNVPASSLTGLNNATLPMLSSSPPNAISSTLVPSSPSIPKTTIGNSDSSSSSALAATFATNFVGTLFNGNLNKMGSGGGGDTIGGAIIPAKQNNGGIGFTELMQQPSLATTTSIIRATATAGSRTPTALRKRQQERNGQQPQQRQIAAKKANNEKGTKSAGNLPICSELPYHMCPHCCLTFAETSAYKAHLSTHQPELFVPDAIGTHQYPVCLENGKQEQQPETLPLKCPMCQIRFGNAFRLNEHMRLHSAQSCELCQKSFMTAFDLNLHMGTHTGYTYDCKDCGKCFPCRKTLAEHNRTHRLILSGNNTNAGNTSSGGNTFKRDVGNSSSSCVIQLQALQQQQQLPSTSPIGNIGGAVDQQQLQQNAHLSLSSSSGGQQQPTVYQQRQLKEQQEQNGQQNRRKMRAPRKGEKSRRNATLIALERTPPAEVMASSENDGAAAAIVAIPQSLLSSVVGNGGIGGIGSLVDRLLAHVGQQQQQQQKLKSLDNSNGIIVAAGGGNEENGNVINGRQAAGTDQ